MDNKLKSIPQFNNEEEEQNFWAVHDSTEYIDWGKAERSPVLLHLKRSSEKNQTNDELQSSER